MPYVRRRSVSATRREQEAAVTTTVRPGDPLCIPGSYGYSPGTWLWWTSAAVKALCHPPGEEDPRAPQPHDHCQRPAPSQCTTGWWLSRAAGRRRVLIPSSLLPGCDNPWAIRVRQAERRVRSGGSVDPPIGRSAERRW